MSVTSQHTHTMVLTALFIALVLLLGMTPLGMIPLGFINVTILCTPVVIGTIILGLRLGLLIGACFGLASTLSAFGLTLTAPSALAGTLAAANPFLLVVLSMAPRLLVPAVAWAVYRLLSRGRAFNPKALPVAAAAGSVTNTVFYLGLMLLFYRLLGLDSTLLMSVIAGTGLLGGGCEAIVCAIISSAVICALWKVQHKI